jgi:poly(A) polymerase
MLRAVRLKNALSFHYGPGMEDAIRACAMRLTIVSDERIRDEWKKMLTMRAASACMQDLQRLQLLDQFAPEVVPSSDTSSKVAFALLDQLAPEDVEVALTALFVGQAAAGTGNIPVETIHSVMQRLRFPKGSIATVELLAELTIGTVERRSLNQTAARRILMRAGPLTSDVIKLLDAMAQLKVGKSLQNRAAAASKQLTALCSQTPPEAIRCPLNGTEIMQVLNVTAGLKVGQARKDLLDLVLEGRLAPGDKVGAIGWLEENISRYE